MNNNAEMAETFHFAEGFSTDFWPMTLMLRLMMAGMLVTQVAPLGR